MHAYGARTLVNPGPNAPHLNPVPQIQGLTYALNEPCKEMLYLPTSDAIKFKAKGWIDVFGSRVAKGVGSFVTLSSRGDRRRLATYGGVASFLIRSVSLHSCPR